MPGKLQRRDIVRSTKTAWTTLSENGERQALRYPGMKASLPRPMPKEQFSTFYANIGGGFSGHRSTIIRTEGTSYSSRHGLALKQNHNKI